MKNEDERGIIVNVLGLTVESLTIREIAVNLDARGVKTRGSGRWYANNVHLILKKNAAMATA